MNLIEMLIQIMCCRYNPMLPPVSALPPHLLPSELSRQLTRSPVNFREGRRSSDGLVSPVAFQQRLYCDQETEAPGLPPLEQVSLLMYFRKYNVQYNNILFY